MRWIPMLFACMLGTVALGGCFMDSHSDPVDVGVGPSSVVSDYGNGVYYFNVIGPRFGEALSQFMQEHPGLEVAAISVNGASAYGRNSGFFVVCRPAG